jgi:hypothetical protein
LTVKHETKGDVMPKVSDVFASQDTIRAADLGNSEYTVVIASVEQKAFDDGNKLVISFENARKKLIANKTNSARIAQLYGDETDHWVGREINLRAEMVDFKGKPTMAVRVQPPPNRPAPATAPAAPAPTQPPWGEALGDAIKF